MNKRKLNLQDTKYRIQNTERGITLVALIITIIVLLVLATVSIKLVMNGGIIERAEKGVQAYSEAEFEEKVKLAYADYRFQIQTTSNANKEETMTNALRSAFNNNSIQATQNGKSFKFSVDDKNYKIKPDGTVKEVVNPTSNIYWKIDNEGVLHIRATSFDEYTNIGGWNSSASSIVKAKIEEPIAPVGSCYRMFYGLSNLEEIEGIKNFHADYVTNMSGMFEGCTSLKKIDISKFDTSSVTSMSAMFSSCSSLTEVNANNLDTSNVTDMSGMFNTCVKLVNLNVNNFDLSSVTTTLAMFAGCNSLVELDLSTWVNTSNVGNMSAMFQLAVAHELTELNLGKNFTIGPNTTYNNILQNVQKDIHITCNSITAEKLGSSFTNVTVI